MDDPPRKRSSADRRGAQSRAAPASPGSQSLQVFGTKSSGTWPACRAWIPSPSPGGGRFGSCAKPTTPAPNAPGAGCVVARADKLCPTQAWVAGSPAPATPAGVITNPAASPAARTPRKNAVFWSFALLDPSSRERGSHGGSLGRDTCSRPTPAPSGEVPPRVILRPDP